MYAFSGPSFGLGLVVGILIILIIFWIMFLTGSFAFSQCPKQIRGCTSADYINDPAVALAGGATFSDVMFERDGKIYYKRIQKTGNCAPASDQALHILEPQYCLFTDTKGGIFEAKNLNFGSNEYVSGGIKVITSQDCNPISATGLAKGVGLARGDPILKWDAGDQSLL